MPEQTILIVEDEENLLEALKYTLVKEGYIVLSATNGEEGLDVATKSRPDLILLDIMLPKIGGLEVCRVLRQDSSIPIIMLTAKGEEIDRVVGLELGADDYVTKPFSMRELVARTRAILRRSQLTTHYPNEQHAHILKATDLEINLTSHTVLLHGESLDLTPKEFDLLALLLGHKGKAFTRNEILDRIWEHDFVGDTRTVDVHIRWIREKIEADPASPKKITTIRGVGYRFEK